MVRIAAYLLLMGITYYLGGMYWSRTLLVLFCTEAALAAVLFMQSRFLLVGAGVEVTAAAEDMERGKPVKASVTIRNRSILPVNKVFITVCCESGGQKEKLKLCGTLPTRGSCQMEFVMQAAHCGRMLFFVRELGGYDCLGLFCRIRKLSIQKEFLILPAIRPMDLVLQNQNFFWYPQEGVASAGEISMEQADYELREYQEGDHQKNIHWKLKARTDELWSRVYRSDREPWTAVFLELSGIGKRPADQKDIWLEILSGLSAGLLEKGWKHRIFWYEEAAGQFTVHDIIQKEDIVRLQCGLLEQKQACEQISEHPGEVLRESFYGLPPFLLSLDMDRTLAINGKPVLRFTDKDYREMCSRRWIID